MLVLEFIFRALPHIFRAKSIQSPSKNGPYAYGDANSCMTSTVADWQLAAVSIGESSMGWIVEGHSKQGVM